MGEVQLHYAVARYLETVLDPSEVRWTHLPMGERRDARTGAKLKQMGVKPGWPDFLILGPNGMTLQIELKAGKGNLNVAQRAHREWCCESGHHYTVARSVDQVADLLRAHFIPTREAS